MTSDAPQQDAALADAQVMAELTAAAWETEWEAAASKARAGLIEVAKACGVTLDWDDHHSLRSHCHQQQQQPTQQQLRARRCPQ